MSAMFRVLKFKNIAKLVRNSDVLPALKFRMYSNFLVISKIIEASMFKFLGIMKFGYVLSSSQ